MKILNDIRKSIVLSYKAMSIRYAGLSMLSDIGFLALFSIIIYYFFNKVSPLIQEANVLISQMSSSMPLEDVIPAKESLAALGANYESLAAISAQIVSYFLLMILLAYMIWCILQGTSWWISHRHIARSHVAVRNAVQKKKAVSWFRLQQRFCLISLFWLAVFILLLMLLIKMTGFNMLGAQLMGLETMMIAGRVALFIIAYFALISFAMLDRNIKEIFKGIYTSGIKKAGLLVPAYILILALMYLVILIVQVIVYLTGIDFFYAVLVSLVFFLPLMAWMRVFMITAIDITNPYWQNEKKQAIKNDARNSGKRGKRPTIKSSKRNRN